MSSPRYRARMAAQQTRHRAAGPGRHATLAVGRLVDLVMPPTCAGCGQEGEVLCRECGAGLYGRAGIDPGLPLGLPSDVPLPLLQLEWCGPFSGPVRAALHALKYGGERRVVEPLADALAARWREAGRGGDLLVPVPVHAERRARRGYDQAALLATATADRLDLPAAEALARTRATLPQFDLDHASRATNVAGAFAVRAGWEAAVRGAWPVLVDDVATTGATLVSCATALLEAGAVGVSALAVARET
ncbi:MAG: phosphoribosyltransferase [Chloroflexi bacterium]|nr:phosphoribosyltransferase [Chloroflexota bacterium]